MAGNDLQPARLGLGPKLPQLEYAVYGAVKNYSWIELAFQLMEWLSFRALLTLDTQKTVGSPIGFYNEPYSSGSSSNLV